MKTTFENKDNKIIPEQGASHPRDSWEIQQFYSQGIYGSKIQQSACGVL